MDLDEVRFHANTMLELHGLTERGWTFRFDKAPSRFGLCSYRIKEISLSEQLTKINHQPEVFNTILHEIAHALHFERHGETGHGWRWVEIAQSIGCDGLRCYSASRVNTLPRRATIRLSDLEG